MHQAAHDLDGLYAHTEFAGVKEDFDPALHETIDAYVAAKGGYTGLADVLEALAYRALARRAFESHGVILTKFPGSKLNDLQKKGSEARSKND